MATLLERLQQALHPKITVLRELGGGGMAVVFLGHDVALDRPVAIKVLRPEQATAVGVERFLREARILARLRHPNIVPVFQGGEAAGLLYHVLEFQRGETLATRLARGPLDPVEFVRLARGLLAALEAAHAEGVVHRDIKPANIFLNPDKAVVADFGIAATATAGEPLTADGPAPGTLAYMAPEQLRGGLTTPQTDLFATGLVLVEALTGQGPGAAAPFGGGIWAGVPRRLRTPLRKALAEDPAARWESASAMRVGLLKGGRPLRFGVMTTAAIAVLTVFLLGPPAPPGPHGRFVLRLEAFTSTGAGPGIPWADSLRVALAQRLRGFPDFVVETESLGPATLRLGGTVLEVNDSLRLELTGAPPDRESRSLVTPMVPASEWRTLVDPLVVDVIGLIWQDDPGVASPLPAGARPRTAQGNERWLRAELAYRDGQWEQARRSYENALAVDSSCAICAYRIRDLDRWLGQPQDTANLARLLGSLDRFPMEYRTVIAASVLPLHQRIDSLAVLASRWSDFFDVQYLLGDELLHRGPLVGRSRAEAMTSLRRARRLRPDFAGVAEHLAWAMIAEGQGDSARAILDELADRHPPRDAFTGGLRAFHELAWYWRFQPEREARGFSARLLTNPVILGSPQLSAGPRALPALGVHGGAIGFGGMLANLDQPDLIRAGLMSIALGHAALGQYSAAAEALGAVRNQSAELEWRLGEVELLALFHVIGEPIVARGEIDRQVAQVIGRTAAGSQHRVRIEWVRTLLASPAVSPGAGGPLDLLLAARATADIGGFAAALAMTDTLSEAAYRDHDPIAGALARLWRAEWLAGLGRHADAAIELLWSEHSDFPEIPTDRLQAAEFDWAISTVAMWRRAEQLELEGDRRGELCRIYPEMARRWQGAASPRAERGDSALMRGRQLGCGTPR